MSCGGPQAFAGAAHLRHRPVSPNEPTSYLLVLSSDETLKLQGAQLSEGPAPK
jgi:hypothetical protein